MFGNHGLGGLLEEGAHEKSPKCLGGNLGDFGEFCKGLRLSESWKQWFEQQKTRACVPHTPYTSVLKFVPFAGGVCGAATHAVGHADYGLLL